MKSDVIWHTDERERLFLFLSLFPKHFAKRKSRNERGVSRGADCRECRGIDTSPATPGGRESSIRLEIRNFANAASSTARRGPYRWCSVASILNLRDRFPGSANARSLAVARVPRRFARCCASALFRVRRRFPRTWPRTRDNGEARERTGRMQGTIIENLSGKKLSVLVMLLIIAQIVCFLIGGLIGE